MRRVPFAFVVAFAFVPTAAWAQGNPLGPEFRVNTYTTDGQGDPKVAFDSAGNFIVVWDSLQQDGSGFGIFGQRYAVSGVPLGPEFAVNTYTTSSQRFPRVASDAAGNFVVMWDSLGQDGSNGSIFGQHVDGPGGLHRKPRPVGVHGHRDRRMAEGLLHVGDRRSLRDQDGREGVAQAVGRVVGREAGGLEGGAHPAGDHLRDALLGLPVGGVRGLRVQGRDGPNTLVVTARNARPGQPAT